MKLVPLCFLAASLGCATAQPLLISAQQRELFGEVVRDAEAAGAAEEPEAAARLAEARSELEYAQHIPMYPDRARLLVAKAQADAEQALRLAQNHALVKDASKEAARHELLAGAATP
jgi:hypothetical protein